MKYLVSSIKREWPTYLALVACYSVWTGSLLAYDTVGIGSLIPAILTVTLHSSLQHEMLHGHPTRSRSMNELLVFPAIGLFIPYRRFRELHLSHHVDQRLTDPYDDPESWYLSETQWAGSNVVLRVILNLNATLLGRVLIGPILSVFGFWCSEIKLLRQRQFGIATAWLCHATGVLLVLLMLKLANVPLFVYLLVVAYPAMSILMIRTFIEHKATLRVDERTAVVESGKLMSLLFLNNNLHAVHHRFPQASWFALPGLWASMKSVILQNNGHYHFPEGYLGVARRYLITAREPVCHPLAHQIREPQLFDD